MKTQQKMEQDFRRILETLMNGTSAEFKAAKKEIERLWNKNSEEFKKYASVALEYMKKFDEIKSFKNQAAFASGLSLFFLVLADEHFKVLKDFVLKLIQSPDGHVREAIRKTADWLYISLSSRVSPFVYPKGKELTDEQKSEQKGARKQYFDYVGEIESLIDKYDDESEDVQYVDEMKPSINKSLQLLWGEVSRREYDMVEDNVSEEIIAKRKEIKLELLYFLNETKSEFDFGDIREVVYNEEGTDDMKNIIAMFDNGQGAIELQSIIEVITDVWNYFPHKTLKGKCPHQMAEEYENNGDKL